MIKWKVTRLSFRKSSVQVLGFPDASVGNNLLASAGDLGSIPESGRFPGEGNGSLTWEVPWTEEPGGLYSKGLQKKSQR